MYFSWSTPDIRFLDRPGVARYGEAEAAVLAADQRAFRRRRGGSGGAGVAVRVGDVAVAAVHGAAALMPAHVVDQPRGVEALARSAMRARSYWPQPSLKMTHMIDGRVAACCVDHRLQLALVLRRAAAVSGCVRRSWRACPATPAGPACRPVVPAVGLDLDVLAHRVEAELLVRLQVVRERLVASARCTGRRARSPGRGWPSGRRACR